MGLKDLLRKKPASNQRISDLVQASETEVRDGLKSFISFLHIALVKILRDHEPKLRVICPCDDVGYNLVISIERVPRGLQPSDLHLVVSQKSLELGMTHVTFNPSEKQIDEVMSE